MERSESMKHGFRIGRAAGMIRALAVAARNDGNR